jgi:type VI secretion system secreted protein VgrG
VESATVVGQKGEEIHTDEFGRVRVHFHWDRESQMDEKSSCWIHVSQSWAGAGYGTTHLPRLGQEVLVDFLGGDPDRPVIVGRVYTNLQKVPYKLPDNKTQSGWRSNSTGGGGGYNEIMFEDANGKELVNIQAERDLTELVKHDATITVKNNRTTTVWKADSILAGISHSVTIGAPGEGPPSPGDTSVTMSNDSITVKTSGATISLGAHTISLTAKFIELNGSEAVNINSPRQVIIDGDEAVLINCTEKPPPDEIEMPSVGEQFVGELFGMIPGYSAVLLGAELIGGERAVDAVKEFSGEKQAAKTANALESWIKS